MIVQILHITGDIQSITMRTRIITECYSYAIAYSFFTAPWGLTPTGIRLQLMWRCVFVGTNEATTWYQIGFNPLKEST